MSQEMLKYEAPLDENGKPYWVPVVVKNRDYLIGHIDSSLLSTDVSTLNPQIFKASLSSDRFNDILQNGKRAGKISKSELKEHIKELIINDDAVDGLRAGSYSEFSSDALSEYFFDIECTCGNYIAFNNALEIPSDNLSCDMCERIMLEYTGHDDDDYIYDGTYVDMVGVVNEIQDELDDDEEI